MSEVILEAYKLQDVNGNTVYPKTNDLSVVCEDGETTWRAQRVAMQREIDDLKEKNSSLENDLAEAKTALENAKAEYENDLLELKTEFETKTADHLAQLEAYVLTAVGSVPDELASVIEVDE